MPDTALSAAGRDARQPFDVFPDLLDQFIGLWDGLDSMFADC